MFAENPMFFNRPSDLNSIVILFVEIDMIFLFQLLKGDSDLGPRSGPVKYAINVWFPLEWISCIDI